MIEVLNWVAQDRNHVFGTAAFVYMILWGIKDIVAAARKS